MTWDTWPGHRGNPPLDADELHVARFGRETVRETCARLDAWVNAGTKPARDINDRRKS